jgi:arabinofuranan 3-O-arabinosyltransferase
VTSVDVASRVTPARGDAPPERPGRRIGWPVLVAAGLWLLVAAVTFGSSGGSFAADAKPELYFAPWRTAVAYLSAWQENPQLGFPSFNVGLVPVAVAIGLIQSTGISPALSVRVLRLLLVVAGAWGAARLYRALRPVADTADPDAEAAGPLVAGTAFVANPYVVVAGGTQAVLLPWAVLPWQLLFLVRALRERVPGRGWRARAARWRWPAAFALAFAAASGMNAGVVPVLQLAAVPVVALVVRRADGLPWRPLLAVLGRCAVLVVALSAYWLVPSALAVHAGDVVVQNSETLEGIFGPSSAAEVLRGLGLWPLYGSGPNGAWVPQWTGYLNDPVVVLLSFALPALAAAAALLARGPVRRLGLLLIAVAVPVMVGVHPPAAPTAFGRALRWAFDAVPGAAAFRTTNKIGSLLVLGVAVLLAAGFAAAVRRWRDPERRTLLVVALSVVLAGATVPAWTGSLYTSTVDLPDYWRAAAADLNGGPSDQRVWLVPGEVLSEYRWSQARPDDLAPSVLSRPALLRTVIPVTTARAANLLAATDVQLQEGSLPSGALSATARYLGVGDLLLRNDTVWEDVGGGRPQVLQDQINADRGLVPRGNYGAPGENTVSPVYPSLSFAEASLPPLQHYAVAGARPVVRTAPAAGTVLVDGDGFAVAPLVAARLLDGTRPFRYLGDLTSTDLTAMLDRGEVGRVVLTDTNRRRNTAAGRLGGSQGPLLPAGADPGGSRTLFDADRQTVLEVAGGSVTATDVGSVFGPVAAAAPENAVDGDPNTGWLFGDFGRGVGQSLTVHFDQPKVVPRVTVRVRTGDAQRIARVRIEVGGVSADRTVDATGAAVLTLARRTIADSVKVTVLGVSGAGFNLVGLQEVQIPGVRLARVARTPRTMDDLIAGLDQTERAALRRTPVDVVLTRVRGTAPAADDEETGLNRDLAVPVSRDYQLSGIVRLGSEPSERDLDVLAGAYGPVRASSTSRAFGLPTVRASQAIDGRTDTAWAPAGPVVGQSLTISAPPRRVDSVSLTLSGPGRPGSLDRITRVRISLDGRPGTDANVGPRTTRIPVPAQVASTVRITVLDTLTGNPAGAVRIAEVGFGGARMPFSGSRSARACVPVATLDGVPVLMRPELPILSANPARWVGCGRLPVSAGDHRLQPVTGWTADHLVLRDPLGVAAAKSAAAPAVRVEEGRGPRFTARVTGARQPYLLITGQALDPHWRAALDGQDLGPPIALDGYAAGWRVDAPGDHTISVRYTGQAGTDAAVVGSAAVALGSGLLVALVRPAAAAPPGRGVPAPAPATAPGGAPPIGDLRSRWQLRGPFRRWRGGGRDATRPRRSWLGRLRRTVPGGVRAPLGWAVVALLAWIVGGVWLAAPAVLLAGWHLVRAPRPGLLIAASTLVLGAVPVVWLALRPDTDGRITARIVLDDPWPGRLAALGLLLLAVGVVRADRAAPAEAADRSEGSEGADPAEAADRGDR